MTQKKSYTSLLLSAALVLALCSIVLAVLTFSAVSINASSHPDEESAAKQQRDESRKKFATAEDFAELKRQDYEKSQAQKCDSPHGTIIGVGNGVVAYSNCNDQTIVSDDNMVYYDRAKHRALTEEQAEHHREMLTAASLAEVSADHRRHIVPVATGWKYQCVEYARRYLLQKFGLVFQKCGGAVEIWRMTFLHRPLDDAFAERFYLERIPNYRSMASSGVSSSSSSSSSSDSGGGGGNEVNKHQAPTLIPQDGDIVIWPIQKDMPFGHVAIVLSVSAPNDNTRTDIHGDISKLPHFRMDPKRAGSEDKDQFVAQVQIAEQNYHNKPWTSEGRLYARELHLYRQANTDKLALKDPDGYKTLGFMRPHPNLPFSGPYSHADDGEGAGVEAVEGGLPQRVEHDPQRVGFGFDEETDQPPVNAEGSTASSLPPDPMTTNDDGIPPPDPDPLADF